MNAKLLSYLRFLETKLPTAELAGIEPPCAPHPSLKPHQRDICEWAIRGGRRAIFAQFGLGKSRMHLQLAAWVIHHCLNEGRTGLASKFLIVAPLGVRHQFTLEDGPAMGLMVDYVRTMAQAEASPCSILITNYEPVRDGDLDPRQFAGAGLDESSCLRSYGSGIYQTFLKKFEGVQFRFVFTATPSPNRFKELIHYSAFLGIMSSGEALTRFFARDSSEAGNLTLYQHMEPIFWKWMMTWAVFLQTPEDLGYDGSEYVLPPMALNWDRILIDHTLQWDGSHFDGWGQGQLFIEQSKGLSKSAKIKRSSQEVRIKKLTQIINDARRKEGAQKKAIQGMVPEEPGIPVGQTEGKKRAELRGKSRSIPGEVSEMEGSESGKIHSDAENVICQKSREVSGEIQKVLRGKQRKSLQRRMDSKTEEGIQHDRGAVERNDESSEWSLQNLPETICGQEEVEGGPLPLDGENPGPAVQPMQRGTGDVQRLSANNAKSDRVSFQCVVWCDLNDEQDAIEKALKEIGLSVCSLRGSQNIDERERLIDRWKRKELSVFLSKPMMYGAGVNLQQANLMIFVGIGYKFQDTIQGVHRIYRFGQNMECQIHFIYLDTEDLVKESLQTKWRRHDYMMEKMQELLRKYKLAPDNTELLRRTIGVTREESRAA
jgi:Helicase conserved C-terminal domain